MTTARTAILVPLTRAQRAALQHSTNRRARRLRRQLVVTHRSGSLPEAEERELFNQARAAAAIAELASETEALIVRPSDAATKKPDNLADVIMHEALALYTAVAANDDDDVAATLANLIELVREAQCQLLDVDTVNATAPGIWRTNGVLTLPKH